MAQGDKTQVVLLATPGISDLNHIHTGTCKDLGGVTYVLTDMANGLSVTTVDASLDSLLAGGFAINLHKIGDPGTYTSCGDIPTRVTPAGSAPPPPSGPEMTSVQDTATVLRTVNVTIQGLAFQPATITAQPGEQIRFNVRNLDGVRHSFPFRRPGSSGYDVIVSGGETKLGDAITLSSPGTIQFFCQFHANMVGTLQVGG
ncbi:MAG: hypothetical protein EXR48_07480 [Dehalococcoidia bacterium]|nr:hypothetical protein [Dehalococcoidia bacterium]